MKEKGLKQSRFGPIHIVLVLFAILQLFPLYFLVTLSLKGNNEIFGENMVGLPHKIMWSNYQTAMTTGKMGLYFLNSVIVTGGTIVLCVFCAIMASFALNRMIWKWRGKMNSFFMLGLTIPIHASLLPIFLILRSLNMVNSYQALILPYAAFSLSMSILICNGFMTGIPRELEEAACLDGCGIYGIFWRVILPLMKPAFSTVGIFVFLQAWNELMFAVIFISKERYRTLTVGIRNLSSAFTTDWGAIGAALVISTIPVIILYCLMSQKIQESMMAGAVKG